MDLLSFIKLGGGLALFIYGMTAMGSALERSAGGKLETLLEKIAGNFFKALLMGVFVTCVIQSSSATTVMVVGFVNAGVMKLSQSVGIIMGANIGTTITAQILSLDSSGRLGDSVFLKILKPSNLAYLIVAIGVVLLLTSVSNKRKDIAYILIGFSILFIGMSTMEGALSPLRDLPEFKTLFATISNPVLGILVGALVTALVQSSSASVGILQALSTTGAIAYSAAIPIILGQNIGTCITAFISSIGARQNARRAAMIHLYFNLIGSIVFIIAIYAIHAVYPFSFWNTPIDKVGIANFHTLFNIIVTAMFIPFHKQLVILAEMSVKKSDTEEDEFTKLDVRFYSTPSLALDMCHEAIVDMSKKAAANFKLAITPLLENTPQDIKAFNNNEEYLDSAEVHIGRYLLNIPIDNSDKRRKHHTEMLYSLSDFEKIGDYSQNIFDNIQKIRDHKIVFSADAMKDLGCMADAVSEIIDLTSEAYLTNSISIASKVEPLEDVVDKLKSTLKSRHIDRISADSSSIETGILYLEIVQGLEKISDHCENIAIFTLQLNSDDDSFNTHALADKSDRTSESFVKSYEYYKAKYYEPIFTK